MAERSVRTVPQHCAYCGTALVISPQARRPKRFCNSKCRSRHWHEENEAKYTRAWHLADEIVQKGEVLKSVLAPQD